MKKAAARRVPCSCEPCMDQIMTPWDNSIPFATPSLQPRFKTPEGCILAPSLGDENDWKMITICETKDCKEEEVLEMYEDKLGADDAAKSRQMLDGGFAAYETEEGYDVFEIIG